MTKKTAEGYLVLVPEIANWGGADHVRGIRIKEYRAKQPKLNPGEIAFKVRFTFEESDLLDAIPTIEIDVKTFRRSELPKVEIV